MLTIVALSGGAAYAVTTTAQSATTSPPSAASVADFTSNPATTVYLEADLNGRNEQTRSPRSPMGDPRGSAMEILRIRGNQVAFEITWHNLSAPTIDRVHAGAAGTAGASVIPMLTEPMSDTVTAVAGTVSVTDARLLARLADGPNQFYANFGDARYPGGAVRGQFRTIGPVDFQRIMHVGPFAALGGGDQEVFAGNDNNARTTAFLGLGSTSINYAVNWTGLTSPTAFTVNRGAVGMNGALAASLFAVPHGLAPSITAVAGTAMNVPASTIAAIKANPAMFHTSLTTARFPGGAARGQLFLTTSAMPTMPTMPTSPTTTMAPPTTMPTQPTAPMAPTTSSSISTPAPPHF
ncbi:MAG TPA: CHRD domain-containing protein [Pseudonocardiaceae bacterium]|nr:CHRD domain-containing protein [Pseudonocardiaceae bacterium]